MKLGGNRTGKKGGRGQETRERYEIKPGRDRT